MQAAVRSKASARAETERRREEDETVVRINLGDVLESPGRYPRKRLPTGLQIIPLIAYKQLILSPW